MFMSGAGTGTRIIAGPPRSTQRVLIEAHSESVAAEVGLEAHGVAVLPIVIVIHLISAVFSLASVSVFKLFEP